MEANELRIGNYVSPCGQGIDKVMWIDGADNMIACDEFSERGIEDFQPIPLDEEWLLKFGFTLMPESEYTLNTYELDEFQLWNKNGDFSEIEYLTNRESIVVKYVHQLQNLFFALKGKELTLK